MVANITGLPDTMLAEIFGFLGPSDNLRLEEVCRLWRLFMVEEHAHWNVVYSLKWRYGYKLHTGYFLSAQFKSAAMERMRIFICPPYDFVRPEDTTIMDTMSNGLMRCINKLPPDAGRHQIRTFRTTTPLRPRVLSRCFGCYSPCTYFEVRFFGKASVGIDSPSSHSMTWLRTVLRENQVHVGWFSTSYGYHSDDGRFYWSDDTTLGETEDMKDYGDSWDTSVLDSKGCTIGCGYYHEKNQMFFTKNGIFQGMVEHELQDGLEYCAAFALHEEDGEAHINFGAAPFAFDFESYCFQELVNSQEQ